MNKSDFEKMLDNKEYKELEKQLKKELKDNSDLETKYQLGICYSHQYERKDEAISIFKELISLNYRHAYMYHFISENISSEIEKIKIIKEGLNFFPNNNLLSTSLLYYLEGKEKEEYFELLNVTGNADFTSQIEYLSYLYKKEDYENASNLFNKIHIPDIKKNDRDLIFLKILTNYLAEKNVDLNEVNSFIVSDNNTLQGMLIRLIEIDLLPKSEVNKSIEMIRQIEYINESELPFIELFNVNYSNHSYFFIDEILYKIIYKLKLKFNDKTIKRKLSLIHIFQKLDWENDIKKTELKEWEKIIIEEIKSNNYNKTLYFNLIDIYDNLNDNVNSFNTYISLIENCSNLNESELYISFNNYNNEDINYVITTIIKKIGKYSVYMNRHQLLFEKLIQHLFNNSYYIEIVKIIDNIDYKKLNYINFQFEMAYSLYTIKRIDEAKKNYLEYIEQYPNDRAVINNIGVIYEEEKNYITALKYYEKSQKILFTKRTADNIDRCKKLILKEQKDKEKLLIKYFTDKTKNINIDDLNKLDYQIIIKKISSIKNKRIRSIFLRDYNELVFNYLTNQSKSTILLCGTLIELLLLYILDLNKIIKYRVGSKQEEKKAEEMNISEMLEVCTKEKLLHNTSQKIIDGVKNFRNFVHPGKELREKEIEIDTKTIELFMYIIRWLIMEFSFK